MTDLPRNRIRDRGRTRQTIWGLAASVVFSTGCATSMTGSMQRVIGI